MSYITSVTAYPSAIRNWHLRQVTSSGRK